MRSNATCFAASSAIPLHLEMNSCPPAGLSKVSRLIPRIAVVPRTGLLKAPWRFIPGGAGKTQ